MSVQESEKSSLQTILKINFFQKTKKNRINLKKMAEGGISRTRSQAQATSTRVFESAVIASPPSQVWALIRNLKFSYSSSIESADGPEGHGFWEWGFGRRCVGEFEIGRNFWFFFSISESPNLNESILSQHHPAHNTCRNLQNSKISYF
jgi:hypothetical protein